MFTEKDKTFNWLVPVSSSGVGRKITEDFRATLKNNTVYVSYDFLNKYYKGTDLNDVHVSFIGLQDEDNPFVVINPNIGIPYFKFFPGDKKAKRPNPSRSNKVLCDLIAKKFNAKRDSTLKFSLKPFQRFNGMILYLMELKNNEN